VRVSRLRLTCDQRSPQISPCRSPQNAATMMKLLSSPGTAASMSFRSSSLAVGQILFSAVVRLCRLRPHHKLLY
jgi:hypothetical protein